MRSPTSRPAPIHVKKPVEKPKTPKKHKPLTARQKSHLRGLGHHLDPVVLVGKDGITAGLLSALEIALDTHELLKLKLSENAPGDRHELSAELASRSKAALIQVIGRTLLLYRRRPETDNRPHLALE